jgi:hypothetical protein
VRAAVVDLMKSRRSMGMMGVLRRSVWRDLTPTI